jgi:CheY-like chemotaxis protein
MANKLDSTSLFLSQVNQHTDVLGNLLTGVTQNQIDDKLLNHCVVSTSMLSSSSSLMDLGDWQSALDSYETLLKTYRDHRLPWDERIAQITSEFIEREDELVASAGLGDATHIDDVVCVEGLQALSKEVSELLEYTSETLLDSADAPTVEDGDEPSVGYHAESQAMEEEPVLQETVESEIPERPCADLRPGVCLAELRRHVDGLITGHADLVNGLGTLSEVERDGIRKDLCLVDFYASSMEMTLRDAQHGGKSEIMGSLTPIKFAVCDVANALCEGSDRQITINVTGEDNAVDLRLLKPVRQILHRLLEDIVLRCERPDLHVEIAVKNENGALRWKLCDNGDNFVNDSRLDPDECLAFYPGLRQVRKILYKFRSLLWVEPDENGATRFAFTTPLSFESDRFKVWKNDGHSVAVLPNQLGSVIDVSKVEIGNDSRGEHLTIDGRRVPVLRLGHIYSGAPTEGDRIAVVGFLEKRIAFYVEGEERLENGTWRKDAVSAWRGMQEGMVEIKGETIPLVDANCLLKRYLTITDVSSVGDASGGVGDDEADDVTGSSAPVDDDSNPRNAGEPASLGEEETDVLVVEQSEVLRSAIATILSEQQIRTIFVDQLEAALDYVERGRVALIISDFRVPSMAAKALADRLDREGNRTPVLVTTSHCGENAEVLVQKLGVAGYISKPLQPDQVLSRVSEFLGSPRTPASRS